MKVKRMPGLLCRSEASTAVCIPTTTRAVVLPRRSCRTSIHLNHPLRYSRLLEELDLPNKGEKRLHGPPNVTSLTTTSKREKTQKAVSLKKPPASTPSAPLPPSADRDLFQVVVMRVSIHCQGCAGKVKKHISKMEGVTSFSIDLESKRVTVMGHISPLSVLESISKVKKAEFWYS